LSLFGSAARGEKRPDSDIDVLVDFLPGARPGLFGVSAMMREFTALQRLNGILEAPDWIAKAITGRTEDEFVADETLCYVVAQKLTTIGEAVARLSQEIRARHSAVPWPDIVGLRNILVHEYFGIYSPLIWQTAADRAPVLREQVAGIPARRVVRVSGAPDRGFAREN